MFAIDFIRWWFVLFLIVRDIVCWLDIVCCGYGCLVCAEVVLLAGGCLLLAVNGV